MLRRKNYQHEWLEFHLLQPFPHLVHGIFLRSLDMSQIDQVVIGANLLNLAHVASSIQVHGTQIELIDQNTPQLECDALMTKEPDLGLLIRHADCQSAIFFDKEENAIANVHCGWRGNVQNIYAHVIDRMQKEWNSKPENILVCISPSLGPSKAEFINHQIELPQGFKKFEKNPNYFDFWEISKVQLMEQGILENHIEMAKMCTFENSADFFSYRREKNTGRHGTIVALKTLSEF